MNGMYFLPPASENESIGFLCGALMLLHSIRKSGSTHDFVALVAGAALILRVLPHCFFVRDQRLGEWTRQQLSLLVAEGVKVRFVSASVLQTLEIVLDFIRRIPYLEFGRRDAKSRAFGAKLFAWSLFEYEK